MLSKKEVKYIQSLCHKRQRDEEGVFVAEGHKLAMELLQSDFEIQQIYALKDWKEENIEMAKHVIEVAPPDLERISQLQTPNKVLVIAKQKIPGDEPKLKANLTVVLDGIQDPGNVGTIIRLADWFGIKQIVCSKDCADIYNPKVVQSTMGSITRVSCFTKNLPEWLLKVDVPVYGALLEGSSVYSTGTLAEGLLLFGNESKGIRDNVKSFITNPVSIPKRGEAESLNVAVAAGIILSHLIRG